MTENFSSHGCQLSLAELSDIAAGGDAKILPGENTNFGKQVGAMTREELIKLYKDIGLDNHDYRFYDGNVLLFLMVLFSQSHSNFKQLDSNLLN